MALLALGGCTSRATKSGSAAEQDSVLQQTAFATDSIAFCEQKDST